MILSCIYDSIYSIQYVYIYIHCNYLYMYINHIHISFHLLQAPLQGVTMSALSMDLPQVPIDISLGKLLHFLPRVPRGLNVYFGFSTSPRYIPWGDNGLASLVLLEPT
jgi:hypothetical protein